jgi:hypothetical protein
LKPTIVKLEQAGVALSFGSIYAALLLEWLAVPTLWPASQLEAAILSLIIVRMLVFLGVPAMRRARASVAVIFFGADVFIVIIAAAAVSVTGISYYGEFGRSFMLSWIGAAPIAYPPLAVFLLLRSLGDGTRLSYVLPGAASFFGMLVVPLDALAPGAGSGGLTGLALLMVSGLKGATLSSAGGLVPFAGALVFVSLLVHATGGSREAGPWESTGKLVLALAGAMFALVWAMVVVPLEAPWFSLGLPVLGAVGVAWLISRGKR